MYLDPSEKMASSLQLLVAIHKFLVFFTNFLSSTFISILYLESQHLWICYVECIFVSFAQMDHYSL